MTVIDDLISYDPSSITIRRHTKVPNAGGFSWSVSDVTSYPIDVRLYFYNTRNASEVTLPEGEKKMIILGLLAPIGTDIIVGHDSFDTFVWDNRTYRIVGAREYDDSNCPQALECDCCAV